MPRRFSKSGQQKAELVYKLFTGLTFNEMELVEFTCERLELLYTYVIEDAFRYRRILKNR